LAKSFFFVEFPWNPFSTINASRSASQLMLQAWLRASWNLWLGPCTQVLPFMVHPLWLPFSRIGSVSQHSAAFLSRMSKYRFVVGYHFVLFDCFLLPVLLIFQGFVQWLDYWVEGNGWSDYQYAPTTFRCSTC
jgi:hypothetical protein